MNKKLSIGLLIALVGFPQISETIYTPSLPDVAQALAASEQLVEATLSIYFIGFALGVSLWGMISDFCGRKLSMLLGIFIYGCATYYCGDSTSIEALLFWRFIQAFGASVGSVITQTILREAFPENERVKLFSVLSGAVAFFPAVGPLIGGFISQFYGWRANFWFLVILAMILIIWSYLKLPETRTQQSSLNSTNNLKWLFQEMTSSKMLWGHILLISGTNGIIFGFYQEAPFLFIEQLKMEPTIYGCFGMLISAAFIIAARISYKSVLNYSWRSIIISGVIAVGFGSSLFLVVVFNGILQQTAGFGLVVISLFLVFFGVGLIIPNSLSQALKPFKSHVGSAGSIFGGIYYCLIASFTYLISFMHNGQSWPLPMYFLIMGFVLAAGSVLLIPQKEALATDQLPVR